jgi:hypothetical protein
VRNLPCTCDPQPLGSMHVLELPGPLKPIQAWFVANRQAGTIILNVIVGLASWALAELVLMPAIGDRPVTPIWPPVGLAVAVIYLGGYRLLPGVALGAFLLGGDDGPGRLHPTRHRCANSALAQVRRETRARPRPGDSVSRCGPRRRDCRRAHYRHAALFEPT